MFSPACQFLAGKLRNSLLTSFLLVSGIAAAQVKPSSPDSVLATSQAEGSIATKDKKSPWYEKISIKGYTQVRYSRLLETNPDLRITKRCISWRQCRFSDPAGTHNLQRRCTRTGVYLYST
jgi:hypothetical protein